MRHDLAAWRIDPDSGGFERRLRRPVDEARRIFLECLIEYRLAGGVDLIGLTVMDLVGRHQADAQMMMVAVSRITNRILAELEQGTRPWAKPWSGGDMAVSGQVRPLRATGQPYRGINVLLLWIEAQASGFVSPSWMTYRQAQAMGAQVRKGESGATIVYYGDSSKTVHDDASGEDREQGFRFLKTYTVFNVAQIDGLPERYHDIPESDAPRLRHQRHHRRCRDRPAPHPPASWPHGSGFRQG